MTPEPNDQEFAALWKLSPEARYDHFIKRVVDFDLVWLADDDEGLLTFNHDGCEALPVWPARRYAQHVMEKSFPEARYLGRDLQHWLDKTLRPPANVDDVIVMVFPDAEGFAVPVGVSDLIADIADERGRRLGSLPGFDPDAQEIDLAELLKPAMRTSMKAKPKGKLP